MRKILFVMLCLVSMVAYSQKRNTYNAQIQEHIKFMNISLNENLETFKRKLRQNNYSVKDYYYGDEYETVIKGNYGGLSDFKFTIDYDYENKIIDSFSGFKKCNTVAEANKLFGILKNYINTKYKRANTEDFNFEVIQGYKTHLYSKQILNAKNDIIGRISLSLSKTSKNEYDEEVSPYYKITIRYTDRKNCLKSDRLSSYPISVPKECSMQGKYDSNINYTRYNISVFSSPMFQVCYLDVNEEYLKFTSIREGKTYFMYAFEQDRTDVLNNLFGVVVQDKDKGGIFQNYIKRTFLQASNNALLCTYNMMETAGNEYFISKRNKSNDNNSQMSAGEAMFCLWEGSARIAKYKADGSYYTRMKAFIRRWNAIAGSGGGSTNWDGLSDAQKAAIHEHDNAR